jgi:chitinase
MVVRSISIVSSLLLSLISVSTSSTTTTTAATTTTTTSSSLSTRILKSFPSHATGDCFDIDNVMTVNVGYYQSWSLYRDEDCHPVRPADIDVAKNGYTHLAYSFASIDSIYKLEPWKSNYEVEIPRYQEFNALKSQYVGLKTLIAIGGWTFNDPGEETEFRFSDTAATAKRRRIFAASCMDFCRRYNFDGIDLDWEFPGDLDHGGRVEDLENYPLLVQEIRKAADSTWKGDDFVITVATPVSQTRLSEGFDLIALSRAGVDFFHLMTYNIYTHYQLDGIIGANTDLPYIFDSVEYILTYIPSNKIVLGLAGFGRTYELKEPDSCVTEGCPFSGGGTGGCGGTIGFMPYFTIEEFVTSGNYESYTLNPSSGTANLLVNSSLFISYDNPETYELKRDYASKACFRGIMWWASDMLKNPIYLEINTPPPYASEANYQVMSKFLIWIILICTLLQYTNIVR